MKALPERGGIAIFNRSYYEELLVVCMHPEILGKQQLHFEGINNFEKYLVDNSIIDQVFFSMSQKRNRKNAFQTQLNHQKNIGNFQLVMCGKEVFGMIT
jgi:polyphosphate kinase 2 (PPK2 family)